MNLIVMGVVFIGLGVGLSLSQPHLIFKFLFLLGGALIVAGFRSIRYARETERMMERIRRDG